MLRIHDRLARPPRIALFGEVNSGKSSLANLLIGESVVPTSVVANSQFPIRFHHASRMRLGATFHDGRQLTLSWSEIQQLAELPVERVEIGLPLERMLKFEIIDTPGTGGSFQDASRFKRKWSHAHLPIWCTVAARAWKESERREWSKISGARCGRGILVVTQADLLPDRNDIAKVVGRLQAETAGLFGTIVPIALPDAIVSSVIGDEVRLQNLWVDSGGAKLERAIESALADVAEQRVASAKRALRRFVMRGQLVSDLGSSVLDALISGGNSEAANEFVPSLFPGSSKNRGLGSSQCVTGS